ncbi:MAG: kelch repeat-containing protein [Kofleriaceae bacterium]
MVVGDGVDGLGVDTWLFDGRTWRQAAPPVAPGRRTYAKLAYDAARGRVVLFDGHTGAVEDPYTWEFDGYTWHAVVTATRPPSRLFHAMTYDGGRRRIVLFGGQRPGTGTRLADTWSYDGVDWTQVVGAAPTARARHALAYDPRRDRTVLFGGFGGAGSLADTWELAGSTWTQVTPTSSPPARNYHVATYDAARQRVVVFGGLAQPSGNYAADLWEYDGVTWSPRAAGGAPPARARHGLVADVGRARLLLAGGDGALGQFTDTWELGAGSWSSLGPTTPAAPTALGLAATYDPARGRLVLVDRATPTPGTWEFDGARWRTVTTSTSPPSSSRARLVYDDARRRVVFVDGDGAPGEEQTRLWSYDGVDWTRLLPGASPPPLAEALVAYDVARDVIVVHDGDAAATWEFDGDAWTEWVGAGPPARTGSAMAYDPLSQRVVLFSGAGTGGDDTWSFDGASWTELATTGSPGARQGHALTWSSRLGGLLLVGGRVGTVPTRDVWRLVDATWTPIGVVGTPPPRRDHAIAEMTAQGRVVVVGGFDPNNQVVTATWSFGFTPTVAVETCQAPIDADGDGLMACADPDCWTVCAASCTPGVACGADAPTCGDDVCDPIECGVCAVDCDGSACAPTCGDGVCHPAIEDGGACPGDCAA